MVAHAPPKQHLRERDRTFLTTRAIDLEVAAERGYVQANGNLAALGFSATQCALGDGLLIPIHAVDGDIAFNQLRPDVPRLRDDKPVKYETPSGARLAIDAHPRIKHELRNPKRRLIVCESAPKADAVISHGEVAVAVVGVWGWRGSNSQGGKAALADWEAIAINDREIVLAFDSDVWTNPHVRLAVERLGAYLSRKAKVKVCRIPPMADGAKQGIDDFIAAGGDLAQLITDAVSFSAFVEQHGMTRDDFWRIQHAAEYLFIPTRQLWPRGSVVAEIGRMATDWVDANQRVHQLTWAPGEPMMIHDRLMDGGGWIDRTGAVTFNLYRPGTLEPGDAAEATRWIEHVCRVYPGDTGHIVNWLAHRVQRPGEKINHALVLGGAQGIGKDTILAPVMRAIGPWNVADVSPVQLQGRFNGFVKSVILRVSEARDLGEFDRFKFYEHLKTYTAAPPDALRVDEKNLREYEVPNVTGVVITTNHLTDGIYLPADDRRHYVGWSEQTAADFTPDYWSDLYVWYEAGGYGHVLAYLMAEDISSFNPKAPPPNTSAFWHIVDAGRRPEDAELSDALDALDWPDTTTLESIAHRATVDFAAWINDRRYRTQLPHRLESAGYVAVRNPETKDGRWKLNGRYQVVYARRDIGGERDRILAARRLAGR